MSGIKLGQKMRERLREERRIMKIGPTALARRIGVEPLVWKRVEAGEVPVTFALSKSLAAAGIDILYVMTGHRNAAAPERRKSFARRRDMALMVCPELRWLIPPFVFPETIDDPFLSPKSRRLLARSTPVRRSYPA